MFMCLRRIGKRGVYAEPGIKEEKLKIKILLRN